MEDMGFIYIIRNNLNQKVYVGASVNYQNRWLQHKLILNQNKHHSIKLQRAWNKYGEENFTFEVIKKHLLNSLYKEEIKYILLYNSYMDGYNMTKGGKGGDWVPVLQFNRKGDFIERFPSITEASVKLCIHGTYIWNCCNNKQSTAGNFQWCYEGEENSIKLVCKDPSIIKPIFKYDINGVFIEKFDNGVDAAKSILKTKNKSFRSVAINIRKCCCLTLSLAYGFQWRFTFIEHLPSLSLQELKEIQLRGLRDPKYKKYKRTPIYQWTLAGDLVKIYPSVKEARLEWGDKIHAIEQCIRGSQMKSHGFRWSREKEFTELKYELNKRKCYYRNGKKYIIQNSKTC